MCFLLIIDYDMLSHKISCVYSNEKKVTLYDKYISCCQLKTNKETKQMNLAQTIKMSLLNLYYKKHLQLLKIFETKRRFLDKIQSVYDIYSNLSENFNHIFLPEDMSHKVDKSSEILDISLKKAKELLKKIEDMNTFFELKETSSQLCIKTKAVLEDYIEKASKFKDTEQKLVALKDNHKLCHHLSLAILAYI